MHTETAISERYRERQAISIRWMYCLQQGLLVPENQLFPGKSLCAYDHACQPGHVRFQNSRPRACSFLPGVQCESKGTRSRPFDLPGFTNGKLYCGNVKFCHHCSKEGLDTFGPFRRLHWALSLAAAATRAILVPVCCKVTTGIALFDV